MRNYSLISPPKIRLDFLFSDGMLDVIVEKNGFFGDRISVFGSNLTFDYEPYTTTVPEPH